MERWAVLVITILAIRFCYEIIKSNDPGSSLFSWHPTCMILGQFLALESVLLFKYLPRGWRTTIHGIIAGLGTGLFCCGFYAIYQNKINYGKDHFTSWHGLFGVCSVAIMLSQSLFGNVLKYGKKLLQKFGLAKLVKVSHRYNGLFSLMLTFTAVMLVTQDSIYLATVAFPSTVYILRALLKTKEKKSA